MVSVRLLLALSLFVLLSISTLTVSGAGVAEVPGPDPAGDGWVEVPLVGEPYSDVSCAHDVAVPLSGPAPTAPVEPTCAPAIRPGARMNAPVGCTMNFIVTDGTDLYIGTAGHCVSIGQRVSVNGVGWVGSVVQDGDGGDWAFVRIDADKHHLVDPTMCRWNGPSTGTGGENVRDPFYGETVLHYGHGFLVGQQEPTRGRAGVTLLTSLFYGHHFLFAGNAAPGDSGSPVRLASGEATGILVAHLHPASIVPALNGQAIIATKFTLAMEALERAIGTEVTLVEGTAALPAPPTPSAQLLVPNYDATLHIQHLPAGAA